MQIWCPTQKWQLFIFTGWRETKPLICKSGVQPKSCNFSFQGTVTLQIWSVGWKWQCFIFRGLFKNKKLPVLGCTLTVYPSLRLDLRFASEGLPLSQKMKSCHFHPKLVIFSQNLSFVEWQFTPTPQMKSSIFGLDFIFCRVMVYPYAPPINMRSHFVTLQIWSSLDWLQRIKLSHVNCGLSLVGPLDYPTMDTWSIQFPVPNSLDWGWPLCSAELMSSNVHVPMSLAVLTSSSMSSIPYFKLF